MKEALLYEGKAKKVYQAKDRTGKLVLAYKNDATAFNGEKKSSFSGKGRLNNEISSRIFSLLHDKGVETHFIERLTETEQLVHQTEIIPLEVVVRNVAAGSITKRLGIEEKTTFARPLVELFYKNDELNDPLINDEHAFILSDVTRTELQEIKEKVLKINEELRKIFRDIHITLVDFKVEFGRLASGCIVLADEISPDTCRLWDITTQEKLDKDVFRQGTGDLIEVYEEILRRLEDKQ
ncbi:MAG: phosphoribosylaminoimidazolesuccinocarboxamide synthase [Bacillota bacterium]|uniref:Phosphoribosylaminoimidazole-succinocarboxamide synthase n=1 Tax=Virgibacillus salarius TaxID=447199 RepID=A0A941DWJ4_9BACI|nr:MULTISPECIES: phosphoribosylaminoimidazolesuccinocarboxamide synthase [Bacillaceae]NAZ08206.1 phosphoribosylaminoimidazolesuccinocarboxamide synthase [Agaribacter marinus]MBR7795493.1 phosphoribosylaminoimidazolesuccinocarboxamide synthase [Virgibacillus salarius]MCC2250320.1 phosphoribosylaminoimidazolesuccinocarboxamide synthase [Virgibacillus sp. AGTR]MDY7043544.1 phosphoribosylaminoimidazolesuccinocarboxamide synthase [Virgibacillus sp. M23]QRZ19811.1 phosphoribosylaminoimidazolesuccino